MIDKEFFEPFPGTDAEIFIQWKGTDVCLDFYCPCLPEEERQPVHIHGEFAYFIKCLVCNEVYELGTQVRLIKVADAKVINIDPLSDDNYVNNRITDEDCEIQYIEELVTPADAVDYLDPVQNMRIQIRNAKSEVNLAINQLQESQSNLNSAQEKLYRLEREQKFLQ